MPSQAFNISATLPAGEQFSSNYTVKQGESKIQGVMTAGPMPDPTTTVQLIVELSVDGGVNWIAIGGLIATGGLTGPKGGPYTDPAMAQGTTYNDQLAKGNLIRGHAIVANPPAGGLPVTFVGTVS